MPSFLRDLRKRTRPNRPAGGGSNPPSTPDTRTQPLSAAAPASNVGNEASNLSEDSSVSLGSSTSSLPPARPVLSGPQDRRQRYSLVSMDPAVTNSVTQQTSVLAPRIDSISDNSWVHQKILLVNGHIGDLAGKPYDGTVVVHHHHDQFPSVSWPVHESRFKALVHLTPGCNRVRLDFISARKASSASGSGTSGGAPTPHTSWININHLPLNENPPLQLAIIVAKDSPEVFDATPERIDREGNDLAVATQKYRMAAYLWQAFTGEQMQRHGFGRRCFRLEEAWQPGTLTGHDMAKPTMRNEAKVHIVRSDKTVQELQDLETSQQYEHASDRDGLFGIAATAVNEYFKRPPGEPLYVAAMFLDTHWDAQLGVIRGHAALGGNVGDLRLAIFGSHTLQSYPSSLEEVVPAFTDCTPTNPRYVANDCNDSGSSWEAANIGIGAHLHEVGHLFGCPHRPSGVMRRDYVTLHRTFVTKEGFCTRTGRTGKDVCLREDECAWHRLDCLRFSLHPCFTIPTDIPTQPDVDVNIWPVENECVMATATAGLAWVELYTDGEEVCRTFFELGDSAPSAQPPRSFSLVEAKLRDLLPEPDRSKRLKVIINSRANGSHTIDNFSELLSTAKNTRIKLPGGRHGYRSNKVGLSQMDGSEPQDVIFDSAPIQNKILISIRIFHGFAVDGLEFSYEDKTSQLFGKRGGQEGGSDFFFDTRRGEHLIGFYVKAGFWIDGIQIWTSMGRRSEIFGNATGGSGRTLLPPRGYTIAGIFGSCGPWLDGFGLVITR